MSDWRCDSRPAVRDAPRPKAEAELGTSSHSGIGRHTVSFGFVAWTRRGVPTSVVLVADRSRPVCRTWNPKGLACRFGSESIAATYGLRQRMPNRIERRGESPTLKRLFSRQRSPREERSSR